MPEPPLPWFMRMTFACALSLMCTELDGVLVTRHGQHAGQALLCVLVFDICKCLVA